jgi:endonuclease G, mitochondrial
MMMQTESLSPPQFQERIDLLERDFPYNCEHVVPQSWFDKAQPMRGDLHHLFACESKCNSFRGNNPYTDFPDFNEAIKSECGKLEGKKFEPGFGKGEVARATLYFLLRYPGLINNRNAEYQPQSLETLLDWHQNYPVTEHERHRNLAIYLKQGNRNPLIDFPDWAEKIDFQLGLG